MHYLLILLAFSIGCIVAVTELVSRYSDSPKSLFAFSEVYLYLLLNGIAAILAYGATFLLDINIGPISLNQNQPLLAVISGLGAMAILRSAVVTIGKDDETKQIGFAPKLQSLLSWVERNYVKKRLIRNIPKIRKIIQEKDVNFSRIVKSLPFTCLNSIQGLTASERENVGRTVKDIDGVELDSDNDKLLNLCISLHEITGMELLDVVISAIDTRNEDHSEYAQNLAKIQELKKKLL